MRRARRRIALVALVTLAFGIGMPTPKAAAEPVRLAAAGSLKAAMTDVIAAFRQAGGGEVLAEYGPSGLLKEKIAKERSADVFASANMTHPQALAAAGATAGPVVLFARNRLCGLSRPGLGVTSDNLLDRMLDPKLRLATSTPKADPSGDYAWALFAKAEALRPGARAALEQKALQLVGGPSSPKPPNDRTLYGLILERNEADLFLTYCTNALQASREVPGLEVVQIPEAMAVGADYGLVVLSPRIEAAQFAFFLLSPSGQKVLARHGFSAPTLPQEG